MDFDDKDGNGSDLPPITRLSRDLRTAAATLSDTEARFLVDAYYLIQENRIRADAQVRAMSETGEPVAVLVWLGEQMRVLENQVKGALDKYSAAHPVGEWARSVVGIGPVIAAGLLAHIDITRAPTAGHIFSFAGLNPKAEWKKGEKRPWNAQLKTLCWKAGESFVKTQANPRAVYGPLYADRKEQEIAKNAAGEFAEQAAAVLEKKRIGKTTEAYKWYSGEAIAEVRRRALLDKCRTTNVAPEGTVSSAEGTVYYDVNGEWLTKGAALQRISGPLIPALPPAHIHARAKRFAVKIFLSNLHEVWYEQHHGEPAPAPYPFAHLGHVHKIDPVKNSE